MNYYGDLHCDTLWRCFENRTDLSDQRLQLKRNPPFRHLQTYAIYIPDRVEEPYSYYKAVYAYGQEMMKRYPDMVHCRNAGEIEEVFSAGKTPYLLSVEGGGFFGGDLARNRRLVQTLKRHGIAFLSLCYNRGNDLAGGNLSPTRGLSPLGKEVALMLREEGISVDLSHANHKTADQLLELLPDGVVATHSDCYALVPHSRNLTDDQILAIQEKKGLIGVNFYPPFLTGTQQATVDDVLQHVSYLSRLGADEVIAFGSDFDGIETTPKGLSTLADLPAFADRMAAVFSEEKTEQYLYGNMRCYLKDFFKT